MIMPGRPIRRARELADLLREKIATGEYGPGARLPSERDLQQTYDLARDTVRAAVADLENEGLIVVRQGYPTRVRSVRDKQKVSLTKAQHVDARMPTPAEREELDIDRGIPLFEVFDEDGFAEIYPADRVTIVPPQS